MTTWVLLLRAVNVGSRNTLAMADLRALLTDLGHQQVRTVLNSGNATFTSPRRSAPALAAQVEQELANRCGLRVRATVRTRGQLLHVVENIPPQIAATAYPLVSVLIDQPTPQALRSLREWDVAPERLAVGEGVLYLGYAGPMHASALQTGAIEKRLGVAQTARTPATLRKLID